MLTSRTPIRKLLVANRGEIAIRIFRAATELNIRTVAVFTYEDRYSLHRYKADEAYGIGKRDEPLKPYLDIEEIIHVAKRHGVDAIHPGYGFLSENVHFARRCREEGIIFVGPTPEVMEQLGDKVQAKLVAKAAGVPLIEDNQVPLTSTAIAQQEAQRIGYPVILKAAAGGGGRGMRVVRTENELLQAFAESRNEAGKAFGDDTIFLEKYVENPKHIEVQIMADNYGNIVHLYERDCSVQRRFQKVVEIAPCITLSQPARDKLYEYALAICKHVQYNNVGTVEFLVDAEENIYFIEVNPRIQVEHTITEEVTGIDIVRSQILIAQGVQLADKEIFIKSQDEIKCDGFAIQCRITTEDPGNDFKPDYGFINAYRNGAGFGIRLDAGSAYNGAKISPFFDSLLVKVSAWGRTLKGASERLQRALAEFRIRGVKTNIEFLINVISHPEFISGRATVGFIANHQELFELPKRLNRANKVIKYLGDVVVNGHPDVKFVDPRKTFRNPRVPAFDKFAPYPQGTKDLLNQLGREDFVKWLKADTRIHYTDTTFRDAHQSLLATRMRGLDLARVAESMAKNHPEVFSMEVWGGATFDVCMRFLKEDPWERLREARRRMPNILLQMLLRGSNAVGYKAYPDNLIEQFVVKSWENGIDIFRIFDSLNWVDNMKVSIKAVREQTGALAEAAISYTGDILNPRDNKYTLQYYLDLARRLEDEGAHLLAIKDMAGLLKPYTAEVLIRELKQVVSLPIHLHTHDTSSIQAATYLKAIEAGVDVVDVAIASMSGLTSQPNFNALVAALEGHPRENTIDLGRLNEFSGYWEDVREFYYPFESGLKAGTAEVYHHEIPGGQYSNLRPQAESLGLGDKFELVKQNYALANRMFGDIVKVTPSSKVVGDFALFMTANDLSEQDIYERGHTLSFPESVINFFKGDLGQPYGGFPEQLQKIILRDQSPLTKRANEYLDPIDFDHEFAAFRQQFGEEMTMEDFLSYSLYPKVFEDFYKFREEYGYVNFIPTPAFFYGLKPNEEILIRLDEGKTLIIKLLYIQEADENGMCVVTFEVNGQARRTLVRDRSAAITKQVNQKADKGNAKHIGAPLQGKLSEVLVKVGDEVKENTPLFLIEAMKMESTITASQPGKVAQIVLSVGAMVGQDDLVLVME
ncbi:pyruvate carboxylase [Eisenibacter elegans]|jgi:pyruvate carboxylase|uniref:pyruvate carboxylase n=1 Tax=Eisenibacter elegans TaxID=997 RepID=UPI0004026225|nr:pyruvate carboxylase [Eisenibacter elegans]